jgi:predicted component of type VI protein secretion system
MPVVDETVHTKEIKAFKKEVLDAIEKFEKRLSALEEKLLKGK